MFFGGFQCFCRDIFKNNYHPSVFLIIRRFVLGQNVLKCPVNRSFWNTKIVLRSGVAGPPVVLQVLQRQLDLAQASLASQPCLVPCAIRCLAIAGTSPPPPRGVGFGSRCLLTRQIFLEKGHRAPVCALAPPTPKSRPPWGIPYHPCIPIAPPGSGCQNSFQRSLISALQGGECGGLAGLSHALPCTACWRARVALVGC